MTEPGSDVLVSAVILNRQGTEVFAQTHRIEKIGTDSEKFVEQSLESQFQNGDLPGAHEGDNAEDFSQGH